MIDFKDKKVNVIGAARSGLASARVLQDKGAKVFLSEFAPATKFPQAFEILQNRKIDCEFGGHTERVYDCELIVTSPGVPANSQVLAEAAKRGIKIISELELGFILCRGNVLAITGSNGKTTTTSLTGEIFRQAGIGSYVAGNIGTPFVEIAGKVGPDEWAIVEVSTFQLEWTETFKPKVAVVLNITPDHLDRHGTMENYIGLKLKIFANQNGTSSAIVNSDDDNLRGYKTESALYRFSTHNEVDRGCYIDGSNLVCRINDKVTDIIAIDKIGIKGPHNVANACAAAACCLAAGIGQDAIAKGLESFVGVEHRLEKTGLIGGVSYVNDSKATNVDAVYWALQSVLPPIIWIAGGRDKAGQFETLIDLTRQNVKGAVLIGEAADKISGVFDGLVPIKRAESLEVAIRLAQRMAAGRGTVLLSPGCASFDMFKNFEHRGRVFKNSVRKLKQVWIR